MSLRLLEVTTDDLPLIEQWLHAGHVRSAWGDPAANFRLLVEPPASGSWRAIIKADGRKVGLVLWQHPTREELDAAGLADIPTSVVDVDIMIGELAALGRGLGSGAISLVAELALSDPTVPFVMACARLDNLASQRAFARADFRQDREFDDGPDGRYVLLVRHRQAVQAAGRSVWHPQAQSRDPLEVVVVGG
jgi:aminoglycoside 6'-N-acetyltransferase